MKGDFSRTTFDPVRHYRGVKMQQGRVQLDSDWNEQHDIDQHIAGTTAADVIGPCGAPEGDAAFRVTAPAAGADYLLSAGRYYVDGILCENETAFAVSGQAANDYPAASKPDAAGIYVVYLDVWERHLTALDDSRMREVALGGPDHATRSKTVWQVKHVSTEGAVGDCGTSFDTYDAATAPPTGKLAAQAQKEADPQSPCQVSPEAGYRGLENQLYRVEVHTAKSPDPGDGKLGTLSDAIDVATPGLTTPVVALGENNTVRVAATFDLKPGQAVEVFATADPMAGQVAFVTAVAPIDTTTREITLGGPVAGLKLADAPLLRRVRGLFKWSRDNGSVVTSVVDVKGKDLTVHDLGPDEVLGFRPGQWVELSDDVLELNGESGHLAQIDGVTEGQAPVVTLRSAPPAIDLKRGPKLRRWDGVGAIKYSTAAGGESWIDLELGVQVRFSAGTYRAHDYWQFPARSSTADALTGRIDWPADSSDAPLLTPPAGIKHHYCRLAVVTFDGTAFTSVLDCRPLFPPLTKLTTLVYVGGDGQETMPGDPLPQLLMAGAFNNRRPVAGRKIRFTTTGAGKLADTAANLPTGTNQFTAETGADGVAGCAWLPDPAALSQLVEARLLDAGGQPLPPPLRFNAQLSVAAQVAYAPGACSDLNGAKTVQDALDILCRRPTGAGGGGCEMAIGEGGQFRTVADALRYLAENQQFNPCLCLLPGTHVVVGDLDGIGRGTNRPFERLTICGCSHASVLALRFKPSFLVGMRSVTLRNIAVDLGSDQTTITFDRCDEVTFDSCLVTGTNEQKRALLVVRGAARVRFVGNVIEASLRDVRAAPAEVFQGHPILAPLLDLLLDRDAFHQKVLDAAQDLGQLPLGGRRILGMAVRARASHFPDAEKAEYARLALAILTPELDTDRPDPVRSRALDELAAALRAVRETTLRAGPQSDQRFAVAVILASPDADIQFTGNDILGAVVCDGGPTDPAADGADEPGEPLAPGQLLNLADRLQRGLTTFARASGTLHATDNHFTRWVASHNLAAHLRAMADPDQGDTRGKIVGAFRTASLANNTFDGGDNCWVAVYLTVTANSFVPMARQTLGAAITDIVTIVGNLSPLVAGGVPEGPPPPDISLFSASRVRVVPAGNMVISIVVL